jgi:N-acetylglucosaminyldiphosphoundecaprenol N-acetyl-beta-D-mannosaminyltransferase
LTVAQPVALIDGDPDVARIGSSGAVVWPLLDGDRTLSPLAPAEAFGFRVHPGTIDDYLDFTASAVAERRKICLFDHNLHSLYLYFRDSELQRLYDQAVVMIDGMPLVLLLRLAGYPVQRCHRITWVDYIWPLLTRAERCGWRVFYLGSSQDTHARALDAVRNRLPRLAIAGHHGYFDAAPDSADNARIIRTINEFKADLCIVGMGTPRQQYWIGHSRAALDAPVTVFCGACMEFVAGTVPMPPRWAGQMGLEWCYRLAADPRRFARRYLAEPWALSVILAANALRRRRPGLAGGNGLGRLNGAVQAPD